MLTSTVVTCVHLNRLAAAQKHNSSADGRVRSCFEMAFCQLTSPLSYLQHLFAQGIYVYCFSVYLVFQCHSVALIFAHCCERSQFYLVIIGSAVWFGPQRPRRPLPAIPVRPIGFLAKKKNTSFQFATKSPACGEFSRSQVRKMKYKKC